MAEAGKIIYGALVVVLALVVVYWFFAWMTSGYSHETEVSSASNPTVVSLADLSDVPQANFMVTVWFYISEWTANTTGAAAGSKGKGLLIMGKKNADNQALQVTFGDVRNDLHIKLKHVAGVTTDQGQDAASDTSIKIENIPVQRWTCMSLSVNGRTVDVYLNGKLVSTAVMEGTFDTPGVKKGEIVVAPTAKNGYQSWEGFTSYLMYSPEPINPQQAWEIYRDGFGGGGSLTAYGLRVQIIKDGTATSSFTV